MGLREKKHTYISGRYAYNVLALSDNDCHFIRIEGKDQNIDLQGNFSSWDEADAMAKALSQSDISNLSYVSMK